MRVQLAALGRPFQDRPGEDHPGRLAAELTLPPAGGDDVVEHGPEVADGDRPLGGGEEGEIVGEEAPDQGGPGPDRVLRGDPDPGHLEEPVDHLAEACERRVRGFGEARHLHRELLLLGLQQERGDLVGVEVALRLLEGDPGQRLPPDIKGLVGQAVDQIQIEVGHSGPAGILDRLPNRLGGVDAAQARELRRSE